jgi:hypothetical protein
LHLRRARTALLVSDGGIQHVSISALCQPSSLPVWAWDSACGPTGMRWRWPPDLLWVCRCGRQCVARRRTAFVLKHTRGAPRSREEIRLRCRRWRIRRLRLHAGRVERAGMAAKRCLRAGSFRPLIPGELVASHWFIREWPSEGTQNEIEQSAHDGGRIIQPAGSRLRIHPLGWRPAQCSPSGCSGFESCAETLRQDRAYGAVSRVSAHRVEILPARHQRSSVRWLHSGQVVGGLCIPISSSR